MLYVPVVNDADDRKRPLFPVVPCTVTVTCVLCGNPVCGVKTTALPVRCQDPAIAGDSTGSGAVAGSGWLYVTVMFAAPLTSLPPVAGVMETRRSGWTAAAACALAAVVPDLADGPPPWVAIAIPAAQPPMATTAPAAHATVFRDRILTVPPLLRRAMLTVRR